MTDQATFYTGLSTRGRVLQENRRCKFEWIQFGREDEEKAFEEISRFANEHSLKLAVKKVLK